MKTVVIMRTEIDNDSGCQVIYLSNGKVITISDESLMLHDNEYHIYSEEEPIITYWW